MPTTQYLPWGTGGVPGSPNTLSYASYAALTTLIGNGFQNGIALPEQVNTVLRQATVAAAGLAKFATDFGPNDCLDDGSVANFSAAVKAALDAILNAREGWKSGDIKANFSPLVPTGWLSANGAVVSRTTYAGIFAAYGTMFGAGDGSTTFQLPDLRGEFLRGWDNSRGVDSGRVIGSAQGDMFKAHTHDMGVEAGGGDNLSTPIDSGGVDETAVGNPTGSAGGTETRPRNVAVHYLIRI